MTAKNKTVLSKLVGKRVVLTDFDGEELNKDLTLLLTGADADWIEVNHSGRVGFFNRNAVAFITEHKEQPQK